VNLIDVVVVDCEIDSFDDAVVDDDYDDDDADVDEDFEVVVDDGVHFYNY
jgi:hypothetical protein